MKPSLQDLGLSQEDYQYFQTFQLCQHDSQRGQRYT